MPAEPAYPQDEHMHTATTTPPPPSTAQTHEATAPGAPHPLDSQDLLRGQNTVAIRHNGSVYHLQATRQGKLILTK